MFNEFLYQNKSVIEKHIKFVIETDTYKIYWTIIIKKQCKVAHNHKIYWTIIKNHNARLHIWKIL